MSDSSNEPLRFSRLLDSALLGLLALVLRLPAFFSERHLTFDDGVFASSALAMRDGALPFRDVFSSQGPLFLPLVAVGDFVGFQKLNSPRVLAVLSGIAIVVGIYWTALRMTDRLGALVAAVLAATSGSLLWVTGPLAADGPALAFAVLAVLLSLRQRDQPSYSNSLLLGLAVGATLSTKAMEAPILIVVGLVLLAPLATQARLRRVAVTPLLHGLVVATSAAALFVMISAPFGFAAVWDQSFVYRTAASTNRDLPANAAKLVSTLWDRDLALILFAIVTLITALWARLRSGPWRDMATAGTDPAAGASPSSRLLMAAWTVGSALWLIAVVSPLWRPHVSAMIPPLALLIGIYRPPLRVTVVTGLLCVPLLLFQLNEIILPGPYSGTEAEVVEAIQQLPDGAWVLSDEPGLVWRAGKRTSDDLVDPSMLRVQQGRYTEDSLAEAASDPRVCAVVIRSKQRFGSFAGLPDKLEDEGFVVTSESPSAAGLERMFVRTSC
jgi:4-amino-4-deoxy-L-arabinose transferase-like glycosyltransferase